MILLFTDYADALYTGQVQAKIKSIAPTAPVVSVIDNLPAFNVKASAYLLNTLVQEQSDQSIVVAIVDPSVGGGRAPVCFRHASKWFVGPDNGLFSRIAKDFSDDVEIYRISDYDDDLVSATFHGRDVFAPFAAALYLDESGVDYGQPYVSQTVWLARDWPRNLDEIVYVDSFGNAISAIATKDARNSDLFSVVGEWFQYAEKFCDVPAGNGFWYRNSIGLVEFAVNQGSFSETYSVDIGDRVLYKLTS